MANFGPDPPARRQKVYVCWFFSVLEDHKRLIDELKPQLATLRRLERVTVAGTDARKLEELADLHKKLAEQRGRLRSGLNGEKQMVKTTKIHKNAYQKTRKKQ